MDESAVIEALRKRSEKLAGTIKRRGFYWPSYEIYGGAKGFYDYGPLGAMLKSNVENLWRQFFVVKEGFAEISTPALAPEEVFIASGHVDKFTDIMIVCERCGESYRADHYLQDRVEHAETMSLEDVQSYLEGHEVKCDKCGAIMRKAEEFNLMFSTQIGGGKGKRGYLRPETAQGIFVNFPQLYRYFRGKLPFGVVQIGRGYRNEISPRQGLIRQREFNMAELELFIDPEEDTYPWFNETREERVRLLPGDRDKVVEMTLGEANSRGIVKNQALAHYIGVTKRFLLRCGIRAEWLRFRQHREGEMAHYANDCWDAEVLTSMGWIEVVGIADRTCFDLQRHMASSGEDMRARFKLPEPVRECVRVAVVDPKVIGPRFRSDAKAIMEYLENNPIGTNNLDEKGRLHIHIGDREFILKPDEFHIRDEERVVSERRVIPHVIEPSFGVDRIIHCILEHTYRISDDGTDGDEIYRVLSLPPEIAPIKAGVFPLVSKEPLISIAMDIEKDLREEGLTTYYDDKGSIGRRYARMDEIGTPYCITVDYETPKNGTVTIRFRDSKEQKRVNIGDVATTLLKMLRARD